MKLNRRDFIKSTSAGTALALASGLPAFSEEAAAASVASKSDVYVGKGTAEAIIPKLLEKMGGIDRFIKKGSRVMIKPNISFANPPEWATTTSPEAIHVLANLAVKAGARKVIVCDHTLRNPSICRDKTGANKAVKDVKRAIIFTPTQKNQFEAKAEPKATELKTTEIVKEIQRCDIVINLPAAKSHSAGGVSLGIKNLMGLIQNRRVCHREMDLHLAIAEHLYYIKPQLTIVDATRALLDNGPAGPGKVGNPQKFIAGTDPVAVDALAVTVAQWYGRAIEGKNVKHIKNAARLGFGNMDPSLINEITV